MIARNTLEKHLKSKKPENVGLVLLKIILNSTRASVEHESVSSIFFHVAFHVTVYCLLNLDLHAQFSLLLYYSNLTVSACR